MNSNDSGVKITPFRLFDQTASRNFKRKMAAKIQAALDSIDFSTDNSESTFLEDTDLAQRMLDKHLSIQRL